MRLFHKKNIVRISLILTSFIILLLIPSKYFYIKNGALYLCILAFLLTIKKEFRFLNYKNKKDIYIKYLVGILLGFLFISLITLILLLSNSIKLIFNKEYSFIFITSIILFWMIQSFFEEYLLRGIIYEIIGKELGYLFAIIVSSIIFTLFHLGNNNINFIALLNIFLFGIITSLLVKKEKNIYLVSGIHFIWNYLQGNVLGFNVSGIKTKESVFVVLNNSNFLINGGKFGLEGSIITSLLFILIIGVILSYSFKLKDKRDYQIMYLSKKDNVLTLSRNNEEYLFENYEFTKPTKIIFENIELNYIEKLDIKDKIGLYHNVIVDSKYYFLNQSIKFINNC